MLWLQIAKFFSEISDCPRNLNSKEKFRLLEIFRLVFCYKGNLTEDDKYISGNTFRFRHYVLSTQLLNFIETQNASMIIKGIKLAVAKLKIAQLVKNRQPEAYSIPIKSIGIIFDFKNRKALTQLEQLKKQFNISDVNFKVVTYIRNGKEPSNFEGEIYSLKNINFDAEINNEGMNEFTSECVDLLITFAEEDNTAVHLLTAHCHAGIKVGRYQQNVALYDMIIQADNDAELFAKELTKYLKQLKKITK